MDMEVLKKVLKELPDLDMVFQPTETGLYGFAVGHNATYAVEISVEMPEGKGQLPSEAFKFNTATLSRLLELGGKMSLNGEELVVESEDTTINWRKLELDSKEIGRKILLPDPKVDVELSTSATEKIKKLSDVLESAEYLFYSKDGVLNVEIRGESKNVQNKANYRTGIQAEIPPTRFDAVVSYALKSSVVATFVTDKSKIAPAKFTRKGEGWTITYYIMPLVDE